MGFRGGKPAHVKDESSLALLLHEPLDLEPDEFPKLGKVRRAVPLPTEEDVAKACDRRSFSISLKENPEPVESDDVPVDGCERGIVGFGDGELDMLDLLAYCKERTMLGRLLRLTPKRKTHGGLGA